MNQWRTSEVMNHYSTIILFCMMLGMQQCNSSGTASKQTADSLAVTGIDYEALQAKASVFKPGIGQQGGEIRLSTLSEPKSFNPITSAEISTTEYTRYLYEGLIRLNSVTLLPEPNLATSWDYTDSTRTWTFHLRPGVVWSDRTPFSSYDVEFTFNNLIYNSGIEPNVVRDVFLIENKKITVTAIDSLTVTFALPSPYAPFLRSMTQPILPKHKYVHYSKKGIFSRELSIKTPPDRIVGTGPFLLESYLSSQMVVFKRNPHYWKIDSTGNRLPYLDRLVYKIVADRNAELLQFTEGKIDMLAAQARDYPDLSRNETAGNYTVFRLGPASEGTMLIFNQNTDQDTDGKPYVDPAKSSWFRNTNFRRAVAYALDKHAMVDIAMDSLGYPQRSPMTPSEGYFYYDSVPQYSYDLINAQSLLKKEGFADRNGDGIIEDASGHPVEFSLYSNSDNTIRQKIAEIIRKNCTALGFKVDLRLIEFSNLITTINTPPYEWDAVIIGLSSDADPQLSKNMWLSNGDVHIWYPRQKAPSSPWEATLDSLFVLADKEIDVTKRKAIYQAWQRIVAEQLPVLYTVLPEYILCSTNKFGNLNPTLSGGLLHNIEYLYVK